MAAGGTRRSTAAVTESSQWRHELTTPKTDEAPTPPGPDEPDRYLEGA